MKTMLVGLVLLGAGGLSLGVFGNGGTTSRGSQGPSTNVAIELGLDPAALAASGFDSQSTDALLSRLAEQTTLLARLTAAHARSAAAAAALTAIEERLASSPYSPESAAAHTAALTMLESASTEVQSIRNDLLEAALDGVGSGLSASVSNCRSSREYRVPPEFKVAQQVRDQWATTEECLIAEARANRRGEDLSSGMSRRLSAMRADQDVAVAGQRVASQLSLIEAIFAGH